MAGGKSSRGGPIGSSSSSKKKKKGKPLSKDPARLAAAIATLSNWAAWGLSCADHRTLALPRMDLHTHSTCSQSSLSLQPNTHPLFPSLKCVSCLKVFSYLTTRVGVVMVVVRALFQPQVRFLSFTHNEFCRYRVDLTAMTSPPIGAIPGVETNNSGIITKSSRNSLLPCFGLGILSPTQELQIKESRRKKVEYNHHRNLSQLHLEGLS